MTIREYEINRAEASGDMDWLLAEEENFWISVKEAKLPPLTVVF